MAADLDRAVVVTRIRYRVWQFWRTLWARPAAEELTAAREHLTPELGRLFFSMSPAEQAHALRVFAALKGRGLDHPSLLAAALLHDVGKSRHPLYPWQRAWVVLGNVFFPERVEVWGQGEPKGWRKAFVVGTQHAEWGAQMLEEVGADDLTIRLVRQHQTASPDGFSAEEAALLDALLKADNRS